MKKLFIDMDGVLADFDVGVKNYEKENGVILSADDFDSIPDLYLNLPVLTGALGAITKLYNSNKYDMFVATTAPWDSPNSLTHKRLWLEDNFGDIFYKRMFTTHRKDLLMGDYLIDDRVVNGAGNFIGEHIHFGSDKFPDWNSVLLYLL